MPHLNPLKIAKRKATSIDPLPAAACDWQALTEATLNAWHQQLHLHAGRQRVARARLCLGSAWAQAGRGNDQLRRLAERLARDGVAVEVLIVPRLQRPELRLGWVAWHAPPLVQARPHANAKANAKAYADADADADARPAQPVPPQPEPRTTPTPGARTMRRNFFLDLFNPQAPADEPAPPNGPPSLAPIGARSAPSAGAQLSQALAQVAEQITDREVRELRELQDTMDCRFQIWTLTFHVSTENESTLRNLITLNQRDDGVAKTLIERAFAKAESARWLNTLRMKVEFKRADTFPREASEVLMVCGRDSVALPFSYTGQIEVVQAATITQVTPSSPFSIAPAQAAAQRAAQPGGAAQAMAASPSPASPSAAVHMAGYAASNSPGDAAAPTDELLLWAQLPGERQLRRWSFKAGSVRVGAAEDATLCVNQHHVSGDHLELTCDKQGRWQVTDRSRNGSNVLDAAADGALEAPLPTGVPRPLPLAGALRLGPLPDDPLLHFHITPAAPAQPAPAATPAAAAMRRRVTQLVDAGTVVALPQAGVAPRRSTGLS